MTNEESICYRAFSVMVDDVEALGLVCECRELEERYSSNFTTQILEAAEHLDGACVLIREAEKYIIKKDQVLLLAEVSQYHHLHMITQAIEWRKLWDDTLDHGLYVVKGIKNLLRVIAYPDHAS